MMGKEVLAAGHGGARSVFIKGGSERQGPGCDNIGFQEADLEGGKQAEGDRGGTGSQRGPATWGQALACLSGSFRGKGASEVPHSLATIPIFLEIQVTDT